MRANLATGAVVGLLVGGIAWGLTGRHRVATGEPRQESGS
jgi:hypothetical protein